MLIPRRNCATLDSSENISHPFPSPKCSPHQTFSLFLSFILVLSYHSPFSQTSIFKKSVSYFPMIGWVLLLPFFSLSLSFFLDCAGDSISGLQIYSCQTFTAPDHKILPSNLAVKKTDAKLLLLPAAQRGSTATSVRVRELGSFP